MKSQRYRIGDKEFDVTVNSSTDERAEVTVNGVVYQVEILKNEPSAPAPSAQTYAPAPAKTEESELSVASGADSIIVASPLPGVIVSVNVRPGDKVKAGQVVAVLEAMKMENEIQSEYDGVVTSVKVAQGDSILEGSPIVTIG